jgi:hypothetical protein
MFEGWLERVNDDVDDCAQARVWAQSDAELLHCLDTAFTILTRMTAITAHLVREIDGRDLPRTQGATGTVAWLRDRLRISPHAAGHLRALAAALERSPDLDAAVSGGAVNPEQARVIDKAVRDLPDDVGTQIAADAEAALIGFAAQLAPPQLGTCGERILTHVAPEVAERAEAEQLRRRERRAHAGRALHLSKAGDGRVRITGWLDDPGAAIVHAAVDPLCAPTPGDTRGPAQRRADALVDLCALALRTNELPASGGEDAHVVLTMPLDGLRDSLGVATLDTGEHLSAAQARQMACDAAIIPAVLGGDGQPLDLGRARRLVTGALRRALVLRDGGCSFPGCDRPPRWCAGHHIRHWVDGGDSCLANTILLCGFHHRVVHHDGWEIRIASDGRPEYLPPAYIDPQRRPRRNHYHYHHHHQCHGSRRQPNRSERPP